MNTIKLFSDINTRTTDIFRRADDTQPLYIALDSVGGSVYEAFIFAAANAPNIAATAATAIGTPKGPNISVACSKILTELVIIPTN